MPSSSETSSTSTSRLDGAVAVLFSGGSDSTLTASILSERFEKVHLLTFRHRYIFAEYKCQGSVESLKKAHGADRLTHETIDITPIMDRVFLRPLARDLKRYGTYALPMCCGCCRLSMHVATISYCRERGIRHAADGANVELSELFPEQMKSSLELYRKLYARYGMQYRNPVFDVDRSDHVLYERGITNKRDFKDEHVVYSNQHSCLAGTLLYGYTLGVSLPLLGRSSREDVAARHIADKIEEFCIPYLESEAGHAVLRPA